MEIKMTTEVFKSICAIIGDLSKDGITKSKTNEHHKYKFRGIDDVYNALSKLLAVHELCILPTVLERDCVEKASAKGGLTFYTILKVKYTIVSAKDGSSHDIVVYGEAMDSSDKSTNKALSAAYKYACLQTFCIPTEGEDDADRVSPQVIQQQNLDKIKMTNLAKKLKEIIVAKKSLDGLDNDLNAIKEYNQSWYDRLIAELPQPETTDQEEVI
jgi:hypothetical protein